MLEPITSVDHEAIMRRAHQLRAEAMAQMVRAMFAWIRRKPAAGQPAKV